MANTTAKVQIRCQQCGHAFHVPSSAAWVICPKCGHSDDDVESTAADPAEASSKPPPPPAVPPARRTPGASTLSGLGAMSPGAQGIQGGPSQLARIALRKVHTHDSDAPAPERRRRSKAAQPDPFAGTDDEFVGGLIGGESGDPETIINTESADAEAQPDRTAVGVEETNIENEQSTAVGALRKSGAIRKTPAPPELTGVRGVPSLELDSGAATSNALDGTGIDLPPRPQSPSRSMQRPPEADEDEARTGVDLPPKPPAPPARSALAPRPADPAAYYDASVDEGATGIDLPPRPSAARAFSPRGRPNDDDYADEATGVDLPPRPGAAPRGGPASEPGMLFVPAGGADDPSTGIDLPQRPEAAPSGASTTGSDLPERPVGRPIGMDYFNTAKNSPPAEATLPDLPEAPRSFAPLSGEVPIETDLGVRRVEEEVIEDDEDDYNDDEAPVALAIQITGDSAEQATSQVPSARAALVPPPPPPASTTPGRAALVPPPPPPSASPGGAIVPPPPPPPPAAGDRSGPLSMLPSGSPLANMPTVGDSGAGPMTPGGAGAPNHTLPSDRPLLESRTDQLRQSLAASNISSTGALDISELEAATAGAPSMQLTALADDVDVDEDAATGLPSPLLRHDSAEDALRPEMPGLGGPMVDLSMPGAGGGAAPHHELTLNKERQSAPMPASASDVGSIGLDEDDDDEPTRAAGLGNRPTVMGADSPPGGRLDDIADDIADEMTINPTVTRDRRPLDGAPVARLPSDAGPAPAVLPQEGIMVFVPDSPIVERQDGVRSTPASRKAAEAAAAAAAAAEAAAAEAADDDLADVEPSSTNRRSEAAGHGLAIRAGAREKERRTWLIVVLASLGAAVLLVLVLVLINQLS